MGLLEISARPADGTGFRVRTSIIIPDANQVLAGRVKARLQAVIRRDCLEAL